MYLPGTAANTSLKLIHRALECIVHPRNILRTAHAAQFTCRLCATTRHTVPAYCEMYLVQPIKQYIHTPVVPVYRGLYLPGTAFNTYSSNASIL